MQFAINLAAAAALFLIGLRLSAFFSGSETGFYRASFLRLSIDASAGDRVARRLLWFSHNPSYFVATTLVGNNVANYLTTLGLGIAAVAVFPAIADWVEIVATLLMAPLVFLAGELLPKNLYYRAPLRFLRRDAGRLTFFYWLFLPASLPLIGIAKLFERFGRTDRPQLEAVFGRIRLAQVFRHGHTAGLLTSSQGGLVHGLLHTAAEPVAGSMTPVALIAGVTDETSAGAALKFAARHGLNDVPVRRQGGSTTWYGYARVIDLAVGGKPLSEVIRTLRRVDAQTSKLEVLRTLRAAGNDMCLVTVDEQVVGIVSERSLVEQLFSSPPAAGILAPHEREG